MFLVVHGGFLSPGWRGDGNSDRQREPELLRGAASPRGHLPGGEGAKSQQTDPGVGTGPSGQLQGEETGGEWQQMMTEEDRKYDKIHLTKM